MSQQKGDRVTGLDPNSGPLTGIGKTFWEALISTKGSTKFVVKLNVNSSCKRILFIEPKEKNKIQNDRSNSVLLTQFLTFLLHQNLRHISSSEFCSKGENNGWKQTN